MDIRTVGDDDFDQLFALLGIAYLDDAGEGRKDRFRTLNEQDRTFGAYDGDELVGSISAFTFDLTVPGERTLPMAGTTIVAVKPTHRRRGLLRKLMAAHFEDVAARGEPLAGLWASEAPIYGRFGFGWATDFVEAEIATSSRILGERDPNVATRMVARETFLSVAPALYDHVRLTEPGTLSRSADWWEHRRSDDDAEDRGGASGNRYVVARRGDQPVGYLIYRTKDDYNDGIATGEIRIREILGLDLDAELALWELVFSIDLTTKAKVYARPVDDPLLHVLEDSRVYKRKVADALYLAVMDVPVALAGRGYSAAGSVNIAITDQHTAGTYALSVDDAGTATCEPTTEPADLTMESRTLGSVYLGGRRINTMARAGRITGSSDKIRLADAMFIGDKAPVIRDGF